MTTKIDVKIEEIKSSTAKFHYVCGMLKHLITIAGALFALRIIFEGLRPFLDSDPKVIVAMAQVIEKLNIQNITAYIIAAGTTTGWLIERKGKKRAIQEKGKLQARVEGGDAYRSSSGLTSNGDTPREEE